MIVTLDRNVSNVCLSVHPVIGVEVLALTYVYDVFSFSSLMAGLGFHILMFRDCHEARKKKGRGGRICAVPKPSLLPKCNK